MVTRIAIVILFLSLLIASCKEDEFDCSDPQIQPAFIKFSSSEIDSFVLRKFKAGDNYQTLLDTFTVVDGYSGQYHTSHDTTSVFVSDGRNGIEAGFDWQLFIPAKNKLV